MKTTKLYQKDVYLKDWDAHITSVQKHSTDEALLYITLDKTAFFPEGGGQSCDTGVLGPYEVIDVQENNDRIIHTVRITEECCHNRPSEGDNVHCSISWDRRFDNMQRHCGEHILSGIFFDLFGGVNRGFHMGQEYMTIDISLEAKPEITEITYEMALEAERGANKVIWSDAPVTVLRFDRREDAENLPLRKALAFDEDISIVCVGSVENAADCVACCGTHPSTAGQVGIIKIYKVEKYKGMFRIYFEAGARALNDYRVKHDILTELSNKYSSSVEDFPLKLRIQEEKLSAIKDELYHIRKAFIDSHCEKLDELLSVTDENVVIYKLPQLSLDDVFSMGKHYMNNCTKLIMLYSQKDTSFILVSDGSYDCGKLVKEYASFYKGKGGGNKVSARAIFTSEHDAFLFADLICKHLS